MRRYSETTISELKRKMPDYLKVACGITDLRRPFRCLNPLHDDENPSMSYDPRTDYVHCFSCGAHGDVFEVAEWMEGLERFPDKVETVACAVGFSLPSSDIAYEAGGVPLGAPKKPAYGMPAPLEGRNLIDEMQKAVWMLFEEREGAVALDYLHGRGFDDALIADSFIGWVDHPSTVYPSMRGMRDAPASHVGYLALFFPEYLDFHPGKDGACVESSRVTFPYAVFRPLGVDGGKKELKPPKLTSPLWREYLLEGKGKPGECVFVTEGIFDAMSLTALKGIQACATCGANATRLIQIAAHTPNDNRPPLLLSFDADKAGRALAEKVSGELRQLDVSCDIAKPYPHGCKDANDLLTWDRDGRGR